MDVEVATEAASPDGAASTLVEATAAASLPSCAAACPFRRTHCTARAVASSGLRHVGIWRMGAGTRTSTSREAAKQEFRKVAVTWEEAEVRRGTGFIFKII